MRSNKFRFIEMLMVAVISLLFMQLSTTDCHAQRQRKKISGCVTHVINYGENLPSLLKRYEVRLSDLVEYNPLIESEFKVGDLVFVPRKKIGKATSSQIDQDIAKYKGEAQKQDDQKQHTERENIEPTTPKAVVKPKQPVVSTIKHTVKAGETFYAISRMYGVTVQSIEEANPTVSRDDMSIGTVLDIVVAAEPEDDEVEIDDAESDEDSSYVLDDDYEQLDITKYSFSRSQSSIRVSLILPLKSDKGQSLQFTEFYQGFLSGLDSLKNEGVSIELNTFNVARHDSKLSSIIASGVLLESDIVVGPVYSEQFDIVAEHLSSRQIPVVSPLGAITSTSSNAFQVAPSTETKYEKLREKLEDKYLILLTSQKDDKEFVDVVQTLSGGVVESIPFDNKKTAQEYAEELPTDKGVVFLMAATDPIEMDAIISKIGAIRVFGLGRDISTVATSRVARADNIDPSLLFDANISYTTSYHADRTDSLVRDFDRKYLSLFGKSPSLYSYRGYDVALFFLGSLKEFGRDFNEYIVDYYTTILQVTYKFNRENPGEKLVNSEWMLVSFKPNYDVEVR